MMNSIEESGTQGYCVGDDDDTGMLGMLGYEDMRMMVTIGE
jgi:hypothetical protein